MAVEFALLSPVFVLLIFGLIVFAMMFSIASGVQQLASESARASVAGLSDAERTQIVQDFVTGHAGGYPFVLPQKLTVTTSSVASPSPTCQVSLTYDLSNQPVSAFASLLPVFPSQIRRSAVVIVSTSL